MARHIPADFVWGDSRLEGYRLLVVPHVKILTRELAEKLTRFVTRGGTLLLGAQSGLQDIDGHIVERTAPGLLAKLAGIEIEDWTTLGAKETRAARMGAGGMIFMNTFVERIRPTAAKTIGRWTGGDSLLGDAPAVTVNKIGKGRVYYFGGYCPAETIDSIAEYLVRAGELSVPLAGPGEVEIVHRIGRGKRYVVALNHSSSPQQVSGISGLELISNRKIEGELSLAGFDVAVLRVR
jgi:beta-galactosidase